MSNPSQGDVILDPLVDAWGWVNEYGSAIGAVAGVVAALVAIVSLVSAAHDSKARSQPMVAAEFRTAPDSDSSLELVIRNFGPTPARELTVEFSPAITLPEDTEGLVAPFIVQRYAQKIPVLNPGQVLSNTWWAGQAGVGNELSNREPTPDAVTVRLSYKGLGWRRIKDAFPLTIETVTLTTYSVSSSSTKGRLRSIDESLKKMTSELAKIARK